MIKIAGRWLGIIAIILGIIVLVFPDIIKLTIGAGLILMGILALIRK